MTEPITFYGFTRPLARSMLSLGLTSIGQNIRSLREKAGYKVQGKFAAALGVPQSRLSDWERSRSEIPELKTLLLIAKKLNVSLDDLIRGTDVDYDFSRTARTDVIRSGVPSHQPSVPSEERRATHVEVHSQLVDRPRLPSSAQPRSPLTIVHELRAHADALSALANDVMRLAADRTDPSGARKKTRRRADHQGVHKRAAGGGKSGR